MGVNWALGDGWGVVCAHTLAWLDPAWSAEDAMACWDHGVQDDFWGLSSRLAGKATGGYALLGFGLVLSSDRDASHVKGRLTVVAAGVVVVARSDVDELLVRGTVAAPSQGELASVVDVQVGPAQISVFPAAGGVFRCGGLHWTPVPLGPSPSVPTARRGIRDTRLPGSASPREGASKPVGPNPVTRPSRTKPASVLPPGRPVPAPTSPPSPAPLLPAKPGPEPEAAPAAVVDNPFSALWGHTMKLSVEQAAIRHLGTDADQPAVPETPPPPVPEEEPPRDEPVGPSGSSDPSDPPSGQTLPEPIALQVPGKPGQPIDSTLMIEVDEDESSDGFGRAVVGGKDVEIHDTVVIGRAPIPRPGEECTLLRVESPDRSISRSHMLLRVVGDQVVAIDLGSNNGTKLLRPGQPDQMVTNTPVPVHDGDTLDLGESVQVRLVGLP